MGRSCNHCTCEMAVLKFIGMFVRSNDRKKGRLMHNPQRKRFQAGEKATTPIGSYDRCFDR